jgi:hypothetical protein
MNAASTLDPDALPGGGAARPPGHDTGSLGPSDLSDTGSDSVGPTGYDRSILEADGADSVGTGVDPSPAEANDGDASDIGFDRVVGAAEAGLGGGLDQAEEANLGVTDEALDPVDEAGAALDPIAGEPRATLRRAGAGAMDGDADALRDADLADRGPAAAGDGDDERDDG